MADVYGTSYSSLAVRNLPCVTNDGSTQSSDTSGTSRGGFATGETLVHIESSIADSDGDDPIFAGDDTVIDSAGTSSDLEILVKVLDGRPLNAQGETLVHVESDGLFLV